MSYLTLEVEIDHGKITPSESAQLPQKGKGLLTILKSASETAEIPQMTQLEALEALQKHLKMDDKKVAEWMAIVRDARR
jgi:hypothetical protein